MSAEPSKPQATHHHLNDDMEQGNGRFVQLFVWGVPSSSASSLFHPSSRSILPLKSVHCCTEWLGTLFGTHAWTGKQLTHARSHLAAWTSGTSENFRVALRMSMGYLLYLHFCGQDEHGILTVFTLLRSGWAWDTCCIYTWPYRDGCELRFCSALTMSSAVWNTKLWSGNMANRWCILSNGGVKLLIQVLSREQM